MEQEQIRRRHLPHWDVTGGTYFVTACLAGSIPALGVKDLAAYERQLRRSPRPAGMAEDAWGRRRWKLLFVRQEDWLDHRPGNRAMARRELARAVVRSMFHFAGSRYDLLAYVVMPSHIHWLFHPRAEWVAALGDTIRSPRERIMYSLRRYTANECNRLSNRRGTFWQPESYDHWARDADEVERIIRYIEENPVEAGMVSAAADWVFSSAWFRKRMRLEWGVPLTAAVGQDSDPDVRWLLSGSES